MSAYEQLVENIFAEEDQEKFEWAVGSALSAGPRKTFVVVGGPASGKSTMLTIVQKIFVGHNAPHVTVLHDGFARIKDPGYLFVASNVAVDETENTITARTTGNRFPILTYSRLARLVSSELDQISILCVERYEELGATRYDIDGIKENNQ